MSYRCVWLTIYVSLHLFFPSSVDSAQIYESPEKTVIGEVNRRQHLEESKIDADRSYSSPTKQRGPITRDESRLGHGPTPPPSPWEVEEMGEEEKGRDGSDMIDVSPSFSGRGRCRIVAPAPSPSPWETP